MVADGAGHEADVHLADLNFVGLDGRDEGLCLIDPLTSVLPLKGEEANSRT